MVDTELKTAFDTLTECKGHCWHSVNDLCKQLNKTESSMRSSLKQLLLRNDIECMNSIQQITYNRWDNGKEITVNRKVVIWRLI